MLGDEPRALRHLGEIAALHPSLDDVARIEAGLERVQKGLNLDGAALERWRAVLRGEL
jgi:hypothetical protein